ncbi:MAG: hypothetical protein RMH97_04235 [Verrucomicrobiales bacterium]|nr:hypothetical protein [Verrucomicrobiales bacterium]
MQIEEVTRLEADLDNFDPQVRRRALLRLVELSRRHDLLPREPRPIVNLHVHTFFSYNAYGYSPSKFAWLARKHGLAVAGVVDFDVLDALAEFTEAGRLLELKTCVSVESRVFVPEFADRVINSPGEPGIAYHMGVGFTTAELGGFAAAYLAGMRRTAEQRNRELVQRVNLYMRPVELDYERDVLPLTPGGNATERHICEAYVRKAEELFPDPAAREAFWRSKLGECPAERDKLQALLRAKTMKRGGVGYVQPGKGSFPVMAEMNRFVLESGAIPTLAWLDGTSEGERCIEELLQVAMATGVAAINIIPDRNFTPGVKDQKLQNLHDVIALAERHGLPVIVGTEMNAPGNKFVDSFDAAELKPFVPVFLKGAYIAYAHSVLQRQSGFGYLSAWARRNFDSVAAKNAFYERVGRELSPAREGVLANLPPETTPDSILARIK